MRRFDNAAVPPCSSVPVFADPWSNIFCIIQKLGFRIRLTANSRAGIKYSASVLSGCTPSMCADTVAGALVASRYTDTDLRRCFFALLASSQ